ncbi:hypothetical protein ONZ45_g9126 [Pleurotus djamor]|nr:hypothetical protein ONZ45_g9126 [Pleurotus djamor]
MREPSPSTASSPTNTDFDDLALSNSDILTPSESVTSTEIFPPSDATQPDSQPNFDAPKKKKKKRAKKAKKPSVAAASEADRADRPPVLCISRNKHWKYISSYHGPWLQLPVELLESLLVLNLDPTTLSGNESRLPQLSPPLKSHSKYKNDVPSGKQRDRGLPGLSDYTNPASPDAQYLSLPPPIPPPTPGKAPPPPIDPGVLRSVTSIRKLVDEAAELSVRASSGLSAAELGSMRGGSGGIGTSPWASQSLGVNGFANTNGRRQHAGMSAIRVHRLRVLAVQKLAQAYKTDEIASSVMVMQGGSVFDDVAERVLKVDPNDIDAKYVHFFHEKIPSRQLAESTTTQVLDELIAARPHRLEFYRTRGIVHCFRDEFPKAAKDFTHALKEARAARKARTTHNSGGDDASETQRTGKKKKGMKPNGQAPPNGTSVGADISVEGPDGETLYLHPSALPDAPDPIEPQLLFLRGASYLQHVICLVEKAILELEGVRKAPAVDGSELRLCYIDNGKYGGVEIGNPDGPLGNPKGTKAKAYRNALASPKFREQISGLLKKCIRDHEKFLTHFDALEFPQDGLRLGDLARQAEYAFLLTEVTRPGNNASSRPPASEGTAMFTTYHPLLVESHFSILLCKLMLGEFAQVLPIFIRVASLVEGLEGYPVFLPPRSMSQAEFVEVLERLAGGWRHGTRPHSLTANRVQMKTKLAIEPPPRPSSVVTRTSSLSSTWSTNEYDPLAPSSSSSAYFPPVDSPTAEFGSGPANIDEEHPRPDFIEALDSLRILLAPVAKRQRQRAEKAAQEKAAGTKKQLSINIPLHGPRVEIILAWLGAVHLPELEL